MAEGMRKRGEERKMKKENKNKNMSGIKKHLPKCPFPVAICIHVDFPSSLACKSISASLTPSRVASVERSSVSSVASPARAK